MNSKTIVITGCSSGFGRVTALTLAHQGWRVFATVRNEEDRANLLSEAAAQNSAIWQTSIQISAPYLEQHRNGPYARLLNLFEKIAQRASKSGFPPPLFANTVVKILTSRNPRTRYAIPFSTAVSIFLRKILPDKLWDWLLRRALRW